MKLPWALIALMTTGSMAADLPTPAVLPQRIYGLVGRPLEIQFADLVYAPIEGSLLFDVETGPGVQGNTSLLWTPEATAKPQPLTIGVFSGQDFRPLANLRTELWTADPQSVIGLILPPPPSEQNGFGKNYGTGVTAWQYRRARQYYLAGILQEFDGRWRELIYVVPANLAFHPETSYPLSEGKAQNALHPNAKGYEVIGDSLAAWIVHLLTEKVISPGT